LRKLFLSRTGAINGDNSLKTIEEEWIKEKEGGETSGGSPLSTLF
jgi:hypothetical protein